ncbi:hypothetical protein [Desulfovibrio ferrophilus]|uniref:Phage protein n=1 Tax=Desulfovibrio ferrophilus TaxID=241368 RepID=A0A2Z6B0Q5_9BACT|nr:hypothetical protein [Desulfovibrio ferrophilus]BBD09043.1 uncharacterized protein DFE_2317 [Desulfovibrio ferrophilus]
MAYDIRLVKLINGEMILGKYVEEDGQAKLQDAAVLQTVPTQQGVQMMLVPFGYPFDNEMDAEIDYKHVIYRYKKIPADLETKYLEAASGLAMASSGDLSNLQGMTGGATQGVSDFAEMLKK